MNNIPYNKDSDLHHIKKFTEQKFSFWFFVPIIGTFLYPAIYKNTLEVNIVDNEFSSKVVKKSLLVYYILNPILYFLLSMSQVLFFLVCNI